jgi:hypothetical protein
MYMYIGVYVHMGIIFFVAGNLPRQKQKVIGKDKEGMLYVSSLVWKHNLCILHNLMLKLFKVYHATLTFQSHFMHDHKKLRKIFVHLYTMTNKVGWPLFL